MDNRINEILGAISDFYTFTDDMAHKYISLIKEAVELLRDLEARPTSMLDNAKNEAVTVLSNELASRMNETTFFHSPFDRRKSDFKISKALVVVAIGNVVHSMSPDAEK